MMTGSRRRRDGNQNPAKVKAPCVDTGGGSWGASSYNEAGSDGNPGGAKQTLSLGDTDDPEG